MNPTERRDRDVGLLRIDERESYALYFAQGILRSGSYALKSVQSSKRQSRSQSGHQVR